MKIPKADPAPAPAAVPVTPPAPAPAGDPPKVDPPADPAKVPPASPEPTPPAVAIPPADPAKADPPKKDGEGDPAKPAGAPEKYEDFQIPDGMTADPEMTAAFSGIAKELDLSQEAAQKLVSFYGEKVVAGLTQKMTEQWNATAEAWKGEILNDPTYGGEKFVPNYAKAHRTVQTFGSEKFIQFLDETKLGDHPEFFRFCMRVAEGMGEDKLLQGGESGPAKVPPWVAMYPTMEHKT